MDRDLIRLLNMMQDEMTALRRRIERLENNATPTVPIYDSTNFPEDAVEGQVVIADA